MRMQWKAISSCLAVIISLFSLLLILGSSPVCEAQEGFSVPVDTALRIRMDDAITTKYSQVGDPFTATVVSQGPYQNARIYGHVANIDLSGRMKGTTSILLMFDRLQMPDGRRASINAEIIQLYGAKGETVDVEGGIQTSGQGRKQTKHTLFGSGAGALMGGIFGGGEGAAIGAVVGGAAGMGTTAFKGPQEITLQSGQEMMIQIVPR